MATPPPPPPSPFLHRPPSFSGLFRLSSKNLGTPKVTQFWEGPALSPLKRGGGWGGGGWEGWMGYNYGKTAVHYSIRKQQLGVFLFFWFEIEFN